MMDPSTLSPQRGGIRVNHLHDGALWRILLATPPANILDREKIEELSAIFERAHGNSHLKVILLEGEGPHFSYGASVQEHLPGSCERMIRAFGRLFRLMLASCTVTLAVVRGRCLGGGLELAGFCHRVFAAPDATLGQPEIALGVLAPVASVALGERVGRSRAEDLCLSGRTIRADEALRIGLVDAVVEDPSAAALDYATEYLLPRSASSLRLAVHALRVAFAWRFERELAEVERLYLEDLMSTHDAREGLQAFIDKRPPQWRDS